MDKALSKSFIFATIWGICSTVDIKCARMFEQFITNIFNPNDMARGSIFDSFVVFKSKEPDWEKWETIQPDFDYSPGKKWHEIIVPNKTTVRYSYLLKKTILAGHCMYFTGVSGTGKSILIANTLKEMKEEGTIVPLNLTFSAKTGSKQVQASIEAKLNPLRQFGKILLKPQVPNTKLVVFVDDINMPEVEKYGAQPPIELLRQVIDSSGFYDRTTFNWKELIDTVIVCASVPPGGGRVGISERFIRHFHLINIPASEDEIMQQIFGTILGNFFKVYSFSDEIDKMTDDIVSAT